jgi:hypothetical protein
MKNVQNKNNPDSNVSGNNKAGITNSEDTTQQTDSMEELSFDDFFSDVDHDIVQEVQQIDDDMPLYAGEEPDSDELKIHSSEHKDLSDDYSQFFSPRNEDDDKHVSDNSVIVNSKDNDVTRFFELEDDTPQSIVTDDLSFLAEKEESKASDSEPLYSLQDDGNDKKEQEPDFSVENIDTATTLKIIDELADAESIQESDEDENIVEEIASKLDLSLKAMETDEDKILVIGSASNISKMKKYLQEDYDVYTYTVDNIENQPLDFDNDTKDYCGNIEKVKSIIFEKKTGKLFFFPGDITYEAFINMYNSIPYCAVTIKGLSVVDSKIKLIEAQTLDPEKDFKPLYNQDELDSKFRSSFRGKNVILCGLNKLAIGILDILSDCKPKKLVVIESEENLLNELTDHAISLKISIITEQIDNLETDKIIEYCRNQFCDYFIYSPCSDSLIHCEQNYKKTYEHCTRNTGRLLEFFNQYPSSTFLYLSSHYANKPVTALGICHYINENLVMSANQYFSPDYIGLRCIPNDFDKAALQDKINVIKNSQNTTITYNIDEAITTALSYKNTINQILLTLIDHDGNKLFTNSFLGSINIYKTYKKILYFNGQFHAVTNELQPTNYADESLYHFDSCEISHLYNSNINHIYNVIRVTADFRVIEILIKRFDKILASDDEAKITEFLKEFTVG